MGKLGRIHALTLYTLEGDEILFSSALRLQFEVFKSIRGGLNKCSLSIYNLNREHRRVIIKEKEQGSIRMPLRLIIAYEKSDIGNAGISIFQGTIFEAYSIKQGTDYVTKITCIDGGFDAHNSFTNKVVRTNDVNNIVSDMPNTKLGTITQRVQNIRPQILVGNSLKLIDDSLQEDETMFIDNETLNILKDGELVDETLPKVTGSTGLIGTPTIKNTEVNFTTLINPQIKVGRAVELNSISAPHINGVYQVITIKYKGDNYGKDWHQECICRQVDTDNYDFG